MSLKVVLCPAPLVLGLLLPAWAAAQTHGPRSAAGEVGALLEIAAGEYELAVSGGEVVDSLELEETRLLLEHATELAASLLSEDPHGDHLAAALDSIEVRVARVAAHRLVRESVEQAQQVLVEGWGAVALPMPVRALSAARGADLYGAQCAECHGLEGRGDGPANPMTPPPTDFTDLALAVESSPARAFQVISHGIPGTGMTGWRDRLGVQERWDLVAHLLELGQTGVPRSEGRSLYSEHCAGCHGTTGRGTEAEVNGRSAAAPDLSDVTTQGGLTGLELLKVVKEGKGGGMPGLGDALSDSQAIALVVYVRGLMGRGAEGRVASGSTEIEDLVASVREELDRALELHESRAYEAARQASLQAYVAFERMERDLATRAPQLTRRLEGEFLRFREAVGGSNGDARAVHARLQDGLAVAFLRLEPDATTASDFLASMVIIVREGAEAALIIAALVAFLVQSGNALHRPSVYWGAGAAIAASLVTALLFELVFAIAPARQEALEGATMLIAVVVLFSVSYWLLSKVEHKRWNSYLRDKMQLALSTRSRFALASVAFLAVYREGFETVLFYKALMGAASSATAVFSGFAFGVLALVTLFLLIYRFGVRIPLRQFFALTSAVLYYMAFVFAGRGIRELQEAGVVSATWIADAPQVDFLGLYPTAEGLAVQGILVTALVLALVWAFLIAPARTRVERSVPSAP